MFKRNKLDEVTTPAGRLESGNWKSRIVGEGHEAPDQLLANPNNWRIHPGPQQDALLEALDKVGWVKPVIVNKTTQHVVDGHLRVGVSLTRGEPSIPVSYVELTEEEEQLVLMMLDPISEMAGMDREIFRMIATEAESKGWLTDGALLGMVKAMIPGEEQAPGDQKNAEDSDSLNLVRCPKCGYEWTGEAK